MLKNRNEDTIVDKIMDTACEAGEKVKDESLAIIYWTTKPVRKALEWLDDFFC